VCHSTWPATHSGPPAVSALIRHSGNKPAHVYAFPGPFGGSSRQPLPACLSLPPQNQVLEIQARIHGLVGVPEGFGESLHVLRYEPGQAYQVHADYCSEVRGALLGRREGGWWAWARRGAGGGQLLAAGQLGQAAAGSSNQQRVMHFTSQRGKGSSLASTAADICL